MKRVLMTLILAGGAAGAQAATIQQTVQVNGATPEQLYETYLSTAATAAFTGAPAAIDAREGGSFTAYDGHIVGKILRLVPGRSIVQTWRASKYGADDLDSTLVLTFRQNVDGAEIDLVETDVPEAMYTVINSNWNLSYWEPMKDYLKAHPTNAKGRN